MHARRVEIRWADLDPLGHVNQSAYLTFAEEAIDDWFRERLGLAPGHGWDYATVRTAIEYRSELRLTDVAAVGAVSLVRLGGSSMTLRCELRAESDGRVAAEVETVAVAFDREARRSRQLTDAERAALSS